MLSSELMARTFAAFLSITCLLTAQTPASLSLTGFSETGAADQLAREKEFDGMLSRANLQQWLKQLSAKPHHLGSPGGK